MKKILMAMVITALAGCMALDDRTVDERILSATGANNPSHRIYVDGPKGMRWVVVVTWRDRDQVLQSIGFFESDMIAMSLSTNITVRKMAAAIRKVDGTTIEIEP
jgi:hypothetical protein